MIPSSTKDRSKSTLHLRSCDIVCCRWNRVKGETAPMKSKKRVPATKAGMSRSCKKKQKEILFRFLTLLRLERKTFRILRCDWNLTRYHCAIRPVAILWQ